MRRTIVLLPVLCVALAIVPRPATGQNLAPRGDRVQWLARESRTSQVVWARNGYVGAAATSGLNTRLRAGRFRSEQTDIVDFFIQSVHVEATNAPLDPTQPSLAQAPVGSTVRLAIYVHFRSLPANCRVTETYTFLRAGKVDSTQSYKDPCPSTGKQVYHVDVDLHAAPGPLTFVGRITVTDAQDNATPLEKQVPFTLTVDTSPTATPNREGVYRLHIPDSAFNPATNAGCDLTVDNALAEKRWFGPDHTKGYAGLGRISGWGQCASWTPPGTPGIVDFLYEGSIFTSARGAAASYEDVIATNLDFDGTVKSACAIATPAPCTRIEGPYIDSASQQAGRFFFDVIRVNACLLETTAQALSPTFSAQKAQIAQTLAAVDQAAVTAAAAYCGATPTPTPTATPSPLTAHTSFSILAARVELKGAPADRGLVRWPLEVVPKGTPLKLVTYFLLEAIPRNSPSTFEETVTLDGMVVFEHATDHVFQTEITRPASGSASAIYTPETPGDYQFTTRVRINGKPKTQSIAFSVGAPPVSGPRVDFAFDRAFTVDGAGKSRKDFRVGDAIGVRARVAVRTSTPTTPALAVMSAQASFGKGWRAVARPILTRIPLEGRGTYHLDGAFRARTALVGRVRLAIALTAGRTTITRFIYVQVKP